MRKRYLILPLFLMLFGIASFAQAGIVLFQNTAQGTIDGGNGLTLDVNWQVAYLGNLGIGTEGNLHSASLSELKTAVNHVKAHSLFEQATVYQQGTWPLGPDGNGNTPWVNPITPDANGNNVGWIGAGAGNTSTTDGFLGELLTNDAGYYAFRITFDVLDSSILNLGMLMSTDNDVVGILFDGQFVNFDVESRSELELFHEGLVTTKSGQNELIIIVSNYGNCDNYGNPVGLWVGSITAEPLAASPTPEPATLLLSGIGGLGLLAFRTRRNKVKGKKEKGKVDCI